MRKNNVVLNVSSSELTIGDMYTVSRSDCNHIWVGSTMIEKTYFVFIPKSFHTPLYNRLFKRIVSFRNSSLQNALNGCLMYSQWQNEWKESCITHLLSDRHECGISEFEKALELFN